MKLPNALVFLLTCFVLTQSSSPPVSASPFTKKAIAYGWDSPSPQQIHDHIGSWQDRPFDGIVFLLSKMGSNLFDVKHFDPATERLDAGLLTGLHWGRFSDNFIVLSCESDMSWTSDADWKIVLARALSCAKVARAAGCTGFVMDPQTYLAATAWDYRIQCPRREISEATFSAIVRKRGRALMSVLQSQVPRAKIIVLYELSRPIDSADKRQTAATRVGVISANSFGLLPSFIDGMLEESSQSVRFSAANESSLFYDVPQAYAQSKGSLISNETTYLAPELHTRFVKQFEVTQSVFVDYIFDRNPRAFAATETAYVGVNDRFPWFKSSLYNAFTTSDEYVWIFDQSCGWWSTDNHSAAALSPLIRSIKKKASFGQPLGFDIAPIFQAAETRRSFGRMAGNGQ